MSRPRHTHSATTILIPILDEWLFNLSASPDDPIWWQLHSACRFEWDQYDIVRFLNFCRWEGRCLIFTGAKSCGGGKNGRHQYGSFYTKGKSIRAHKFGGVALLGLRPEPGFELDHNCRNTRCVYCLEVVTPEENRARIRR